MADLENCIQEIVEAVAANGKVISRAQSKDVLRQFMAATKEYESGAQFEALDSILSQLTERGVKINTDFSLWNMRQELYHAKVGKDNQMALDDIIRPGNQVQALKKAQARERSELEYQHGLTVEPLQRKIADMDKTLALSKEYPQQFTPQDLRELQAAKDFAKQELDKALEFYKKSSDEMSETHKDQMAVAKDQLAKERKALSPEALAKAEQADRETTTNMREAFDRLFLTKWKASVMGSRLATQAQFDVPIDRAYPELNIKEGGLWKYIISDKPMFDQALDYFFDDKTPGVHPIAQKIGQIMKDVHSYSVRQLNSVGNWVTDSPAVLLSSNLMDPVKLRSIDPEFFAQFLEDLYTNGGLDKDAYTGMDDDARQEHWKRIYQMGYRGEQYQAGTGSFDNHSLLTERNKNMALTNMEGMRIQWAKSKAGADAFKQFVSLTSDTTPAAWVMRRIDQIGRSVGLQRVGGPNPTATVLDLFGKYEDQMSLADKNFLLGKQEYRPPATNWQGKVARAAVAAKDLAYDARIYSHPLHQIAEMDGSVNNPDNPNLAMMASNVRAAATMMSLPAGVFAHPLNFVTKAPVLGKLLGDPVSGFLGGLDKYIASIGLTEGETKELMRQALVGMEHTHYGKMRQMLQEGHMSEGFSNNMDSYYKANLMQPLDDANKGATKIMLYTALADALKNPESLTRDAWIHDLTRYGLTDHDIDILRQSAVETETGQHTIMPDAVKALDEVTHQKLLGAIDGLVGAATMTPDFHTKAVINKGTNIGSPGGVLLRMTGMFQQWMIKYMTETQPRVNWNYGRAGQIGLGAALFVMAGIIDALRQTVQGKTPRDMTKPSNWLAILKKSGALGMGGDYISTDYNAYGQDLAGSIAGPVAMHMNNILKTTSALAGYGYQSATGGPAKFPSSQVGHLVGEFAPIAMPAMTGYQLPMPMITQPLFQRALLNAIMTPEALHRMDRQLQTNTGQSRIY
jgi:hypothetical protein